MNFDFSVGSTIIGMQCIPCGRCDYRQSTPIIRLVSEKAVTNKSKKMVRFSDYEYIKPINQSKPPVIPRSAYKDLKLSQSDCALLLSTPKLVPLASDLKRSLLVTEFNQPCASPNFIDRVRGSKVCLENCVTSTGAGNLSITCIVRVLNIAFEKQVTIRHTLTNWSTHTDSLASYLPNSCDGFSDRFSVTFSLRSVQPNQPLAPGQKVSFAVRFRAGSEEFWDNNYGDNYTLRVIVR
ncbi:glycogen-binding subunit 76A-like [Brevipalpus obovatus]|uniref:glycogen-binding subunit 76A-like n=1 Tax=Brevipalpus obovatus TaxID=246614 RepID=UPI003D9EB17D